MQRRIVTVTIHEFAYFKLNILYYRVNLYILYNWGVLSISTRIMFQSVTNPSRLKAQKYLWIWSIALNNIFKNLKLFYVTCNLLRPCPKSAFSPNNIQIKREKVGDYEFVKNIPTSTFSDPDAFLGQGLRYISYGVFRPTSVGMFKSGWV